MSLYPFFNNIYRAPRLLDQHFGLTLDEDDLNPMVVPRYFLDQPSIYPRLWKSLAGSQDSGSAITLDKDRFQANLDVQQFKPDEITVKLTDENVVTIEGKHEEKQDEHGYISRHFVRKYVLPKNCDANRLESRLSSDGVLTITAPTIDFQVEHKSIPIQRTGEPAKKIEKKPENDS